MKIIPYVCTQAVSLHKPEVLALRYKFIDGTPQRVDFTTPIEERLNKPIALSLETEKVALEKVDDVEEYVIANMLKHGQYNGKFVDPHYLENRERYPHLNFDNPLHIGVFFNKRANRIAMDTRRGRGNIVIIHESDADKIPSKLEELCGFKIYAINKEILKGTMIMLYKGEQRPSNEGSTVDVKQCDGAPILAVCGDHVGLSLNDIEKYVKVFDF